MTWQHRIGLISVHMPANKELRINMLFRDRHRSAKGEKTFNWFTGL